MLLKDIMRRAIEVSGLSRDEIISQIGLTNEVYDHIESEEYSESVPESVDAAALLGHKFLDESYEHDVHSFVTISSAYKKFVIDPVVGEEDTYFCEILSKYLEENKQRVFYYTYPRIHCGYLNRRSDLLDIVTKMIADLDRKLQTVGVDSPLSEKRVHCSDYNTLVQERKYLLALIDTKLLPGTAYKYKVVAVDNFDRDNVNDRLVAENIGNKLEAKAIVELLNSREGRNSDEYFKVYPQYKKLYVCEY